MQDFFDYLEYSISRALANSTDKDRRRCWCDGIMPPAIGDSYVLQQSGNKAAGNCQAWIAARAWIIKDEKGSSTRHEIYEMTVFLGHQALAAYQAGEDMKGYVPAESQDNWIELDTYNGSIAIALL